MKTCHVNFETLQILFGPDLRDQYPDLLRFDCRGRLPLIFEKIWESPSEIHYEVGHRKWAGGILIQGPEMVISVKPQSKSVEAVSTSFALSIDDVVIPYDDDKRDFQAKENVDQNGFLCEWLNAAFNRGFERTRPQTAEQAELEKESAVRAIAHELVVAMFLNPSGKGQPTIDMLNIAD